MLYLIGLGLCDEKDITVKGLEAVKKCKRVYLEDYTSLMQSPVKTLEKFYGKKIILADRKMVEQNSDEILNNANKEDVALLVVGDPMGATTHVDFILRAKEKKVPVKIIHNTSIINAVGITGLQLYKFGMTTSIVFKENNWMPETPYSAIKMNKVNGLHTLCLLDIKKDENRFMTVNEALDILLELEDKRKEKIVTDRTLAIGCARIGSDKQLIKFGKVKDLKSVDFGKPPHCLIIPGRLHFMEEEALKLFD
jgi:diphthine synthase